jgi:hypothetical protein
VHAEEGSGAGAEEGAALLQIPRFSIIIFDHCARAARSCAVFFVPPGRETDYQFTSESGLAELAAQAQCRRLLAVRCNRPHQFPAMAELQSELSPLALYLAPGDTGPPDEDAIPFLAVQEESDWEEVARGALQVAGEYVVEEMSAEEEADRGKFVWRRLLFLQNQHFVQTEAKLLFPGGKKGSGKKGSGGKKGGKSKAKKGGRGEEEGGAGGDLVLLFDHSYLDDHHRTMLAALLCDNSSIISAGSLPRGSVSGDGGSGDVRALLVGLGGGALAMALQRYLPSLRLDVVDLVPGLAALAGEHFGFVAGPRCRTLVQDGVQYILKQGQQQGERDEGEAGQQYHSVLLDVDSKDNALGLSAPPPAFLAPHVLRHLHDAVLLPGGSLCLNVVARDKSRLAALVAQLKEIFCAPAATATATQAQGKVYCLKPSAETVNLTLHAVKAVSAHQAVAGLAQQLQSLALLSTKTKIKKQQGVGSRSKSKTGEGGHEQCARSSGGVAELRARERCLESWLGSVHASSDPLSLGEVIGADVVVEY